MLGRGVHILTVLCLAGCAPEGPHGAQIVDATVIEALDGDWVVEPRQAGPIRALRLFVEQDGVVAALVEAPTADRSTDWPGVVVTGFPILGRAVVGYRCFASPEVAGACLFDPSEAGLDWSEAPLAIVDWQASLGPGQRLRRLEPDPEWGDGLPIIHIRDCRGEVD